MSFAQYTTSASGLGAQLFKKCVSAFAVYCVLHTAFVAKLFSACSIVKYMAIT